MQNFKFDIQRFDDSSSSFGILATLNNVLIALRLNELATDFKDNPIGYLKKNANPILKFIGTYLEDITGGKSNEKSKIKSFASILVSGISIIDSAVKISNYAKEKETHAIEISRESELIISELANITNEIVKLSTGEKSFILSITASAISLVANGISTLDGVTDAEKDKINAQYLGFIKVLNKDIVKKLFNAAIDSELNKIDLDDVAKNLDILKNTTILDNISDTLTKTGGVLDLIFAAVEGVQNGIKKYQDTFKKYIEDGIPEDIAKRDAFINAFTAVIHDTAHAYSKGFDDVAYNGIKTLIWALTGKEGIKGNYVEVMTEMLKVFNYTNTGDAEDNYLLSFENNSMVYGYDGNDYIVNMYSNVSLFGGHDDDTIVSQLGLGDDHSTTTANSILGGPGKDLIMAYDNNSTILGGDDIDRIGIFDTKNKIYGGNDTDAILLKDGANDNTINGGLGDDVISLENVKNAVIEYSEGDGNDLILGYNEDDIILINGNYSTQTNEQDVIIVVDNDSITLSGASGKNININNKRSVIGEEQEGNTNTFIPMPSFWYPEVKEIRGTNGDDKISNTLGSIRIDALAGNDTISNNGSEVTVLGGIDNDSIQNGGSNSKILGGEDNDKITNYGGNVTIEGGEGDDSISNDGSNISIEGGKGDDSISNDGSNISIMGGTGDDTISNSYGNSVIIDGGAGNDSIYNSAWYITISSGAGEDLINNRSSNVSIDGGSDGDYITNYLNGYTHNVSISGNTGNDTLLNIPLNGYYGTENESGAITLDGGDGDDSIYSSSYNIVDVTNKNQNIGVIKGGAGNDSIYYDRFNTYTGEINYLGAVSIEGNDGEDLISIRGGGYATINTGSGNDIIYTDNLSSSINAGTGNDTIYGGGAHTYFKYASGDGNDMIFSETDSVYIAITGETYSRIINGNDVILTVGEDSLTLKDAKDKSIVIESKSVSGTVSLLGTTGDDYFYDVSSPIISKEGNSTYDNSIGFINTFDGNDYIYNTVNGATVLSGADDDSISNKGSKAIINGNTGNDFIDNNAESVSIDGGTDNDYIYNTGSKVSINGGEGSDTIENGDTEWKRYDETVTIDGGNGNDVIKNVCYDVTINGGDGDDTITNDKNASINGETGNNLINLTGIPQFGTATINVSSGNDTININSEVTKFTVEEFSEEDVIVFSSAITSLNSSENSLLAVVNNSTVTVEGLTFSQWKLENNVAYYHPDGVSGSYLSDDSLKIYYRDSIISPLLELDGVTDKANFNVNGKTVSFDVTGFDSIVSVNKNTGNYNFYLKGTLTTSSTFISTSDADDITNGASNILIDSNDGNDSIDNSGSNGTINGGSGSDTIYNRVDNVIINGDSDNDSITTYYAENVTINGGAKDDKITNLWSENVIIDSGEGNDSIDNYGEKVLMNGGNDNDTIFNYASTVTINGDDGDDYIITSPDLHFSSARSDYVYVLGGTGNDTISNEYGGQYVTIEGGSGNDSIKNEGANTLFKYKIGEGNDYITGFNSTSTLSISSNSYSSSKSGDDIIITVGDNSITLNGVANLYEINITRTTLVNETTPADTISTDEVLIIDKDKMSVTLDSKFKIADASKHTKPVQITGNDLDNSIIGGKGNDTLDGTKGKNTLTGGRGKDIFVHNGGNDTITDYEKSKDKISLDSSRISNFTVNDKDLTLAFGDNTSLTLDNMANKQISFLTDSKTNKIIFTENASLDGSGKDATLTSNATEFSALNYPKLKNINAESVSSAVSITGNSKANRIIAGNNDSTLNGGKGKDTLFGGNGTDIFVYNNKSGNKIIQNYSPDDIISLTGAQITDAYVKSNDVILKAGSKKITVKDAASKDIIINEDDTTKFFSAGIIYNQDETSAVITKKFTSKSEKVFDNTVTEIDASNAIKKLVLTSSNTTGTTIYGGRNKDSLTGNSGNDFIYGDKGKDSLYGSAGNDSLIGDKGNDKLFGGTGADSLWGGKGNDTLYGDDGSDTFLYSKGDGKDVIFNFSDDDLLQVSGTFSAYYNSNKNEVSFKVASTSNAITLKDFSASSFNVNGNSYKISGDTLIKK